MDWEIDDDVEEIICPYCNKKFLHRRSTGGYYKW